MPPDPLVLAFDTSVAHCAAALLCGPELLVARVDEMARGQGAYLMPMLSRILTQAGYGWHDLAAIGVGTGPGNFTGIRISVSAARGLALGLRIPAIGVSGFEAISFARPRPVTAVIDAPRDMVYTQRMTEAPSAPSHVPASSLPEMDTDVIRWQDVDPVDFIANIARISSRRLNLKAPRPAPLYIRAADASPPTMPPPVILP